MQAGSGFPRACPRSALAGIQGLGYRPYTRRKSALERSRDAERRIGQGERLIVPIIDTSAERDDIIDLWPCPGGIGTTGVDRQDAGAEGGASGGRSPTGGERKSGGIVGEAQSRRDIGQRRMKDRPVGKHKEAIIHIIGRSWCHDTT